MLIKLHAWLIFCFLFLTKTVCAQSADDIAGKWINPSGEGQIQIYKKGNLFFGKLIWLKFPNDEVTGKPKTDIKNPEPGMHTHPILGLEILKNFTHQENAVYEDGTIYDPKNGKTYSCKMTLAANKLKIRGYIGISLLGRTEVWTRVK